MRTDDWLRACAVVLALFGAGCAGTETTNALTSFEASDCKKRPHEVALVSASLESADAGAPDAGSDAGASPTTMGQCVTYTLDADVLTVQLTELHGPCGASFGGAVEVSEKTLVLKAQNSSPGCLVARCGGCRYDFDFAVEGVVKSQARPLRIEVGECADGSQEREVGVIELTLPLDEKAHGTLCFGDDGKPL